MKLKYSEKSVFIEDSIKPAKFKEDQFSFESEEYIVKTCGYFLNMDECLSRYSCKTPIELVIKLVETGNQLPRILHGSYIVVLFIKKSKKLYIFNDLLSKHSIFYYHDKSTGNLLVSDSFFDTLQMVRNKNLPFTIDSLGVKMMLWHRMFYDNLTYIREIKFLRPFEYVIINNNKMTLETIPYPKMIDVSMDEAADEIHKLFTKAVQEQYQKNEKNNYPQITTLSGGMDSRSTFLYGLSNGYTNQMCYCVGESTSADFACAQPLAIKCDCDFYFHPIDKGKGLLKREEICSANEGQMSYLGVSYIDIFHFYKTEQWGIIHTGLGGGEIMGDMRIDEHPSGKEKFIESLKYRFGKGKKDRSWGSFVNSLHCTEEDKKRIEAFKSDYADFNAFQSLNDMRRCLNVQKVAGSFGVEYVSPYLNEDFFYYMLQIPYTLTKDRKLYLYWQKKYNPGQFETPSTFQLGCRPENKVGYFAKRFYKYVMNRMGKKTGYDMIPIELWLKVNPKIKQAQDTWYETDMKKLEHLLDPSLSQLLKDVWNNGTASQQNILTATWTLSRIYD